MAAMARAGIVGRISALSGAFEAAGAERLLMIRLVQMGTSA
jgi:hypothetical protein